MIDKVEIDNELRRTDDAHLCFFHRSAGMNYPNCQRVMIRSRRLFLGSATIFCLTRE